MPVNEAIITFILLTWSLIWRGLALWRAAKQAQRNWFIVLLIINTLGILDILYLFRFSHKRMTLKELKEMFRGFFSTSGSK